MKGSRDLYEDERGAIMVVAVFMAVCLAGALWYTIGMGENVLFRERMQDGADAVAFSAAVYHARGMNIIAMMNIIMASILAVLVALKCLQILVGVATAIACVMAVFTFGALGPACGFLSGMMGTIQNFITVVQKVVDVTLPVISKAQVGVAAATPWTAEAKSLVVANTHYREPVTGGFMLGASLVPLPGSPRLYGLPVQEDDYKSVCKEAGGVVVDLVFFPFGGQKWLGWLKGVAKGIVGTFPQYFCGDTGSVAGIKDAFAQAKDDIAAGCQQVKDEITDPEEQKKFDVDKCKKDKTKKMEDDFKKQGKLPGASGMGTMAKTPKKVFDWAENGNGFFQVWSIVNGNNQWITRSDKGVSLAAWGTRTVAPTDGDVQFAQAEFYYDTPETWAKIDSSTMWNMKWKARLRRFHPVDAFTSAGSSVMGAKLNGYLDDQLKSKVFSKSKWLVFFNETPQGKTLVTRNMHNYAGAVPNNAVNEVENLILGDQSFGVIH